MKTLFYVPTRGDVWHETAAWCALQALDLGLMPIFHQQAAGVSVARNEIVRDFLAVPDAEILVMMDDDVVPAPDSDTWRQILGPVEEGLAHVSAAVVPIKKHGSFFMPNVLKRTGKHDYEVDMSLLGQGGVHAVDAVGTGLVAIHRSVLEHQGMRPPFDALRAKDGTLILGEDTNFCRRAQGAGFTIVACFDVWCEHVCRLHANEVAQVYMSAMSEIIAYDSEVAETVEGTDAQETDAGAEVEAEDE